MRVTPTAGGRVEGTLVRMDADSVVLRPRSATDGGALAAYPTAAVGRVEVSRGRSRHPIRGALIGITAGTLVGGLAARLSTCQSGDCSDIDPVVTATTAIAGAVVGTVVGTAIGYHGHTRWQRVGGAATVALAPHGGLSVGLSRRSR